MQALNRVRDSLVVVLAGAALAASGCGKDSDRAPDKTGSADKPAAATTANPPKPTPSKPAAAPLTAAFFGSAVAPPAPLARFPLGMPSAEAKKLAPDAWLAEADVGVADVRAIWIDDGDRGTVSRVSVRFPVKYKPLVAEAWGPSLAVTGEGGKDVYDVWFNRATKLRATMSETVTHEDVNLDFERYVPLAEFLGDGPTIDFFDRPILGATVADVKRDYAAKLDRGGLTMPALETTLSSPGAVYLDPDDGSAPVSSFRFSISYRGYAALEDELMAAFVEKWGEPKPSKRDPDTMVFHPADPVIEAYKESGKYMFTVRAK